MAIEVRCQCGETLEVSGEEAGSEVECEACGEVVAVPEAPPEPEESEKDATEPAGDDEAANDEEKDDEDEVDEDERAEAEGDDGEGDGDEEGDPAEDAEGDEDEEEDDPGPGHEEDVEEDEGDEEDEDEPDEAAAETDEDLPPVGDLEIPEREEVSSSEPLGLVGEDGAAEEEAEEAPSVDDGRPRCGVCGTRHGVATRICPGCGIDLQEGEWTDLDLPGEPDHPLDTRWLVGVVGFVIALGLIWACYSLYSGFRAESALDAARSHFRARELDKAADAYRRAHSYSSDRVDILAGFAEAQARRGEREEALDLAGRALELESGNRRALFVRGLVRAERGEWEGAASDLEEARSLASPPVDLLGYLALCRDRLGQTEVASDLYRRAIERATEVLRSPEEAFVPPDLREKRTRWRQALARLRLEAGAPEEALRILSPALEAGTASREARWIAGRAHRRLGDWSAAADAFERLVGPGLEAGDVGPDDARPLLALGTVRIRVTPPRHEAAIRALEAARDVVPEDEEELRGEIRRELARARLGLAGEHEDEGRLEAARELARATLEDLETVEGGNAPGVSLLRGDAHRILGEVPEARRRYERAATSRGVGARAWRRLAALELADGRPGEATGWAERIPLEERTGEDWLLLGRAFESLEQFEDARGAYERAKSLLPEEDPRAVRRLADLLGDMGRSDEAITELELLVERGVDPVGVRLRLARLHTRVAQQARAAEDVETARAEWTAVIREAEAVVESDAAGEEEVAEARSLRAQARLERSRLPGPDGDE